MSVRLIRGQVRPSGSGSSASVMDSRGTILRRLESPRRRIGSLPLDGKWVSYAPNLVLFMCGTWYKDPGLIVGSDFDQSPFGTRTGTPSLEERYRDCRTPPEL